MAIAILAGLVMLFGSLQPGPLPACERRGLTAQADQVLEWAGCRHQLVRAPFAPYPARDDAQLSGPFGPR